MVVQALIIFSFKRILVQKLHIFGGPKSTVSIEFAKAFEVEKDDREQLSPWPVLRLKVGSCPDPLLIVCGSSPHPCPAPLCITGQADCYQLRFPGSIWPAWGSGVWLPLETLFLRGPSFCCMGHYISAVRVVMASSNSTSCLCQSSPMGGRGSLQLLTPRSSSHTLKLMLHINIDSFIELLGYHTLLF